MIKVKVKWFNFKKGMDLFNLKTDQRCICSQNSSEKFQHRKLNEGKT